MTHLHHGPGTHVTGPRAALRVATRSRLDFVAFLLLPLAAVGVEDYPLSELAMAFAAGVVLLRVAPATRPLPLWFSGTLVLLVAWMSLVAMLQGLTPVRRMAHLLLFCLLAVLIARGRFVMRSMGAGLATGLLIAGGAGLLGIGTDYDGRLTGLLGDPNQAGFYLLTLGAVSAAHQPSGRRRRIFVCILVLLILLTLSRTSLVATGLVGVWILVGRRMGPLMNVTLVSGLAYAVARASDFIRLAGPFAERAGSDALRERITAAEHAKIASGPWFGNGPGTGTVSIDDDSFFFHSSYLALRNEGGWIAVVLLAALGLGLLFALAGLPRARRNLWLEGGIIGVAICAVNLGEVLLELPTAVVLGSAAHYLIRERVRPPTLQAESQGAES